MTTLINATGIALNNEGRAILYGVTPTGINTKATAHQLPDIAQELIVMVATLTNNTTAMILPAKAVPGDVVEIYFAQPTPGLVTQYSFTLYSGAGETINYADATTDGYGVGVGGPMAFRKTSATEWHQKP